MSECQVEECGASAEEPDRRPGVHVCTEHAGSVAAKVALPGESIPRAALLVQGMQGRTLTSAQIVLGQALAKRAEETALTDAVSIAADRMIEGDAVWTGFNDALEAVQAEIDRLRAQVDRLEGFETKRAMCCVKNEQEVERLRAGIVAIATALVADRPKLHDYCIALLTAHLREGEALASPEPSR